MKAAILTEFGGPEQLRVVEMADPVPGTGQVRIAVHCAGTNPVDAGNRTDGTWAGLQTPCVLGYDVAGVVDQVGGAVSGFAVGDRVMAMTPFPAGAGGYAELVVVDADQVAHLDRATTFLDAAATPLAGGTAMDLLTRLALPVGARMLVLGASGGVGLFLLQLAAARRLEPIAVGRGTTHPRMRSLGATACVDYTTEDVAQRARKLAGGPVDAIVDLVGGDLLASALDALRPGGQIATIASPLLSVDPIVDHNLTLHGLLIRNDGDRTRRLAGLLADGTLRPVVSHVLPLAEAARAHAILDRKHPGGKVVLDVATDL